MSAPSDWLVELVQEVAEKSGEALADLADGCGFELYDSPAPPDAAPE